MFNLFKKGKLFFAVKLAIFIIAAIFLQDIIFAQTPGIKITEPINNSTVTPGQEVSITVEPVNGFEPKEVLIVTPFLVNTLTTSPFTTVFTLPDDKAGIIEIAAAGKNSLNEIVNDSVTLNIGQTANLESLEAEPRDIFLDVDGQIQIITYGIYSDGVKRDITEKDKGTSYAPSDANVAKVDEDGFVSAISEGKAIITVTNLDKQTEVSLMVEGERGIPSAETVPPATIIDIQPPTNSDGWHHSDITINLSASDNEGGSGVMEIHYLLRGINEQEEIAIGSAVQVSLFREGSYELLYSAWDQEFNRELLHSSEFNLDKTPPVITATVTPEPNQADWHNSNVTVSFTATDSLSGVKSVTSPVTVSTEGAKQSIAGEAIDIADNKSSASAILNIDKTPPSVTITANPSVLWSPDNKMVDVAINGDATDSLSGIESLTFKVTDEYGKVQPTLTDFGSTIKLEASRDGNDKDERTYTISATAKDKAGNESTASVTVTVPHDQRNK